MPQVKEYVDHRGESPFAKWFDSLRPRPAAKVTVCVTKLSLGTGDMKGVGKGVYEFRIHAGSGYRIYFGKDGDELVILLCGGPKKSQKKDIEIAQKHWKDYKARKKAGGD